MKCPKCNREMNNDAVFAFPVVNVWYQIFRRLRRKEKTELR